MHAHCCLTGRHVQSQFFEFGQPAFNVLAHLTITSQHQEENGCCVVPLTAQHQLLKAMVATVMVHLQENGAADRKAILL
eukprot:6477110-Amphidinium_carterae.1